MNKFIIKATKKDDDRSVYFNVRHVVYIEDIKKGSHVCIKRLIEAYRSNEHVLFKVKESADELVNQIKGSKSYK